MSNNPIDRLRRAVGIATGEPPSQDSPELATPLTDAELEVVRTALVTVELRLSTLTRWLQTDIAHRSVPLPRHLAEQDACASVLNAVNDLQEARLHLKRAGKLPRAVPPARNPLDA